jgi:hypothetical protein
MSLQRTIGRRAYRHMLEVSGNKLTRKQRKALIRAKEDAKNVQSK